MTCAARGSTAAAPARPVRAVLRDVEAHLRPISDSAQAEAQWLVAEALAQSRRLGPGAVRRTELYLEAGPVEPEALERIDYWLARRQFGEPLAYVTGSVEFFGRRFDVSPAVLIPRPETEVITERAAAVLRRLQQDKRPRLRVLDLGAGSGNIAISLALAVPACVVVALELSWDALCTARLNAIQHAVDRRISWVHADWCQTEAGGFTDRFDLIVSNPPYVPTAELERLPSTVRWEPRLALDGGPDGLDGYRHLLPRLPQWLAPGGIIGFECGEAHHDALTALCAGQPWVRRCERVDDLAGRRRGLFLET